ncbi:hypothetical protein [Ruegeria sp.]|uniref:O-antigen ligase family protein n=1 Tax=Ruegeria sp. TaxID=1879320 RepID=UPI00231BB746|nr:hypothetical protein [Ruegeria sp.]MDA7965965.1 hypothetical protein [Ruegeria sp.]
MIIFLVSLLIPLTLDLGGFKLLTYRVVLLLLFFPALVSWIRGDAGRHMVADYMMIFLAGWVALAMLVVNGVVASWQGVGIHTAEMLGSYMLGRSFVRTPEQFLKVSRILVIGFVLMLPFALAEALTSQNFLLKMWDLVGPAFGDVSHEQRLGFDRVQGPFEHPIHFGVYGGALIGLAFYVVSYGRGVWGHIWRTFLVVITAFFSLSSGPLAAMTMQISLISWDLILERFKQRWWVLAGIVAVIYVVLDILSNRTPIEVMISYFALNAQTGYGRILIFEHGMKNVIANPLFGLGFNDWVRPAWMTSSVDMYWIYYAMVNGIPAGFMSLASYFAVMIAVIRRPMTDDRMRKYRMGWVVSMLGLFMAGWMVHFWKVPFVLYCFLLGLGGWFINYQPEEDADTDAGTPEPKQGLSYTRFPTRPGRRRLASE